VPEQSLYLIAGGPGARRSRGPDPLVQAVISATGITRPRVAYVGAASGDNAAFLLLVGRILRKSGAGEVTLAPLCGRRGSLERALPVLEQADLVFVSGGDVEAGMSVLAETGMTRHLRRLHRAGKPFFGISAGSIMLARQWVRWTDPQDDGTAEVFPCLGFAPVICDTHGEEDDWTELKALLSLCPVGATGYGIVSGSALVARGPGNVAALGGEVHVFRRRRGGVTRLEDLSPSP
jgi:cyanophycinase-like exopeptidase